MMALGFRRTVLMTKWQTSLLGNTPSAFLNCTQKFSSKKQLRLFNYASPFGIQKTHSFFAQNYCQTAKPFRTSDPESAVSETDEETASITHAEMPQENTSEVLKGLSAEENHQLQLLQAEYDMWKYTGTEMPELTDEKWLTILRHLKTPKSRERKYAAWLRRQKARAEAEQNQPLSIEEKFPDLIWNVDQLAITKHYNNNLAHAMMFGTPLVIDMSYEDHMTQDQLEKLMFQFLRTCGRNRCDPAPFHLFVTGVKSESRTQKIFQTSGVHKQMITVTEDSYLDHFPPNKLIYLSRDSGKPMKRYDQDAVYILGGVVKKKYPASLNRARKQNIPCVSLPLDVFVKWKQGIKTLPLHYMLSILLEMKASNNWRKAFQHLPRHRVRCIV